MCLNSGNRWLMIEEVGDGWQSHYSYSRCRLGSHGTDRLVSLVKQTRNQAHTKGTSLFGAKITGGGCGGTVCVLGRTGAASQNQILQVMMALKHFKICLREWGHETLSSIESRMLHVSCELWFFSSLVVQNKPGFQAFTGQLLIQDLIHTIVYLTESCKTKWVQLHLFQLDELPSLTKCVAVSVLMCGLAPLGYIGW